jgi:P pilus assembly chaperone PapD
MQCAIRAILFIIFITLGSQAWSEISFSVSPIRLELAGSPGGSYTDGIEVRNEGSEKARIKVSVQDWYLSPEGTPIFQKPGSRPNSCASWIKVNPVDFLLLPGEKKVVRYSITIPPTAKEGGYWGAFILETLPLITPGEKAKSVSLKGNIASIIYLTTGTPTPNGDITDMRFTQSKDGQTLLITMRNTGTVHFRLKGDLNLVDDQGKKLETLPVPDTPVLPGYTRIISIPFKQKLVPGRYTATITLDIGAKALLAGETFFIVK